MAKQTYYFSHDGNARNDDRIIAVRLNHGMEGYGIYFAILERLLESSDFMSVKDYNIIAFDLRVSAGLVKKIVEDYELFSFSDDGKYFYSESFNRRMIPLEELRVKRSEAGKKGNAKRWNNPDDIAERSQSDIKKSQRKEKEIKEKENKVKGYEDFSFEFLEEDYKELFSNWLEYKHQRRETYKTQKSLEICYKQLKEKSNFDKDGARLIIEQSMANNWAGLFELKDQKGGNNAIKGHNKSKPDYSEQM